MKQIYSYYVSNGTVKVKLEENSQPISITHSTDFDKDFHGIDLGHPSYMYQSCCIYFFFLLCSIFMMLGCLPVLFGVFTYKKLCFLEISFSGVDPFVYLIYFPAIICLLATISPLLAIILTSSF